MMGRGNDRYDDAFRLGSGTDLNTHFSFQQNVDTFRFRALVEHKLSLGIMDLVRYSCDGVHTLFRKAFEKIDL
jgi:hypothetical protein